MMRSLILISSLLAAPALAASTGQIIVVGHGEASSAPEFARLSVEVTSICYDTSRAAKDANAVLANKLLAVLKGFAQGPHDKVLALGGVNVRRTEVVPDGTGSKVLCTEKWRAGNSLILETTAIDALPEIQDQILASVDASAPDPQAVAQTYAELGQPSFNVFPETVKKLRATAQGLAYDDARAQFDVFATRCSFQNPVLVNVTPPEYEVVARKNGDVVVAQPGGGSTPIIPDEITVNAAWKFTWEFTPSGTCLL